MGNPKRPQQTDRDDVRTAPESGDAETEVRNPDNGLNALHDKQADDERDMEKLDPDQSKQQKE